MQKGHDLVVERLLTAGADLNASDQDGSTPLAIAKQTGHAKVLAMLHAAANVAPMSLWRAAQSGDADECERLISLEADKEEKDGDGRTPLFIAVMKGHEAAVGELLAGGCAIDAQSNKGYTPLYMAAHKGDESIVGLLCGEGADKEICASKQPP